MKATLKNTTHFMKDGNSMDSTQLGRIIKICRESGVSSLSIDEGKVHVYFFDPLVKTKDTQDSVTPSQYMESVLGKVDTKIDSVEINDDADSMLHLTDPAAWEREQMDQYKAPSVADSGVQDDEDLEDV
jgi:hypothetical protein